MLIIRIWLYYLGLSFVILNFWTFSNMLSKNQIIHKEPACPYIWHYNLYNSYSCMSSHIFSWNKASNFWTYSKYWSKFKFYSVKTKYCKLARCVLEFFYKNKIMCKNYSNFFSTYLSVFPWFIFLLLSSPFPSQSSFAASKRMNKCMSLLLYNVVVTSFHWQ